MVSYTRFLVNDPSTAASQMWSDQEVKNAINDAVYLLADEARLQETGIRRNRTYTTTVADQIFYQLPDDYTKVVAVEIDVDGNDLSTSGSTAKWLDPIAYDIGFEGYETGIYTTPQYYTIHANDYIAILAPPSTGGTNALRLTYEKHAGTLTDDDDEPGAIPRPYHYLICYEAAAALKGSADLVLSPEHERRRQRLYARFLETSSENAEDNDGQVYVAGVMAQRPATVTGFIQRSTKYPDRSRWPE